MAAKKFIVELDAQERARLNALIFIGKAPAKVILKARILLKADEAATSAENTPVVRAAVDECVVADRRRIR